MPNSPQLVTVQTWADHHINPVKDLAADKHVFFVTPLIDASGTCLDKLSVPATVDFVTNAYLTAAVESPYDLALMAQLYDDDRIYLYIIEQEDIDELTRRARDSHH